MRYNPYVVLAPRAKYLPVTACYCLLLPAGETKVLNIIKPYLTAILRSAVFASFTLPERIFVPLMSGAPDVHKPEGVLKVGQSVKAACCQLGSGS